MKATGIVRRIDDLGRVVIPKEIRRTLKIRESEPLEIFTDRNGEIILKKYSPIGEFSSGAQQLADAAAKTCGKLFCICDQEQVVAAAKAACCHDFIMALPDGYDTKVGSFGSRFSGGEKQRIAIARAILKNAPILILDEATSASDPENQMEIDKAIQNLCKGKTVIVVAHRLSALKLCDRVAVVENHTITCIGTHEEVRKKNAYYRKAWEDYEKARNITYQLEGGEGNA